MPQHVKREVAAGYDVAVVVSAMSGKTNELVAWCKEAAPMFDQAEYDTVVASGEQVTSGLMAMVAAIGTSGYSMVDDHALRILRSMPEMKS